ncbi:allose-binding protein [Paenibacillus algorifonticola]|uniref:Allose-binding protein n=1 Tax=Paenibacillus algorifonticola TaxID=684063 RepID=A0A1I2F6N1_9BACL|nr:D-allose transporter substrate-binding protein [Paenibacillus algorifonticola]SFF00201.1 allose-binding protein [Paenibacillus algorifonticola]
MKKTNMMLLMVMLTLAIIVAGCGNQAGTTNGASGTSPAASTDTAAGGATDAAKPKFAIILKTLSNPFWVSMKEGIEAEAKAQGYDVDIFAANDEADLQGQAKIFEDALDKGYAGIAFAPLSPVAMIPSIVKANEKGIYVVNIDEQVDMTELKSAGGYVFSFVTTDNVKVGEKGGQAIIDKLGAEGGKVAIIEGKAGNASGENRKQGATNAFKAAANIEIVDSQPADWDRTKALDVAANILQKNPDLKAFYAANDTMALGALQAVSNAGKQGQVIVVGTDGAPEALDSINAGELYATVAQDPAQVGISSLNKLVQLAKDKATGSADMEPEFVSVESKLVTK